MRLNDWCASPRMRRPIPFTWTIIAVLVLVSHFVAAEDWPQWLGPKRDGVWREDGILERFPDGGPKLRWSVSIGGGYAGPSVADGRVFVMDYARKRNAKDGEIFEKGMNENWHRAHKAGQERLLCLNEADGRVLWTREYPTTYTHAKLYANGPRTTPLVDSDRVYTLGAEGRLSCFEVKTGKERWSRDLKADYRIKAPTWGFGTHPLIDGDRLIAIVGGKGTAVVAFNKHTGKELWRAASCRNSGYAQPVILEHGGQRQLLAWHGEALCSIQPETGRVYWSSPVKPRCQMTIGMPRLEGNRLFIMSWACSRALELGANRPSSRVLWKTGGDIGVGGQMSTTWIEDGHIYAGGLSGIYRCVELATGKRVWDTKKVTGSGKVWIGCIFTVKQGSRFFLTNELGDLVIAKMSPAGYDEVDRARIIKQTSVTQGKPVWWSHPAFANRSIYVRNDHTIHCYSLARQDGGR